VLIKQCRKLEPQYSHFYRRSNTICCHVDCWLLDEIQLKFHFRCQSHYKHNPLCRHFSVSSKDKWKMMDIPEPVLQTVQHIFAAWLAEWEGNDWLNLTSSEVTRTWPLIAFCQIFNCSTQQSIKERIEDLVLIRLPCIDHNFLIDSSTAFIFYIRIP
jgi:hypothetical protein